MFEINTNYQPFQALIERRNSAPFCFLFRKKMVFPLLGFCVVWNCIRFFDFGMLRGVNKLTSPWDKFTLYVHRVGSVTPLFDGFFAAILPGFPWILHQRYFIHHSRWWKLTSVFQQQIVQIKFPLVAPRYGRLFPGITGVYTPPN